MKRESALTMLNDLNCQPSANNCEIVSLVFDDQTIKTFAAVPHHVFTPSDGRTRINREKTIQIQHHTNYSSLLT